MKRIDASRRQQRTGSCEDVTVGRRPPSLPGRPRRLAGPRATGWVLLAGLLFGGWSPLAAGSLWLGGTDLYVPHGSRSFKPGDIVTVIIQEQAKAQQKATTDTQDNSQVEVKANPQIPAIKSIWKQFVGKHDVKNTWSGNGTTTRSGSLDATVSAQVIEVLANGNVVLEGSRRMRVNKETQVLRVRGIARPRDITANNTVPSTALADAEIKYEGKGSVGSTQRPGIITKVANWIF